MSYGVSFTSLEHCWLFWIRDHSKSTDFYPLAQTTYTWNVKLKFQYKLQLCSGNNAIFRKMDRQTDMWTDGEMDRQRNYSMSPLPTSLGRGIKRISHSLHDNNLCNSYNLIYALMYLVSLLLICVYYAKLDFLISYCRVSVGHFMVQDH